MLREVQRSSSQPPWKVRAYCRTGQYQRGEVCIEKIKVYRGHLNLAKHRLYVCFKGSWILKNESQP
jgi:hypothetical protein